MALSSDDVSLWPAAVTGKPNLRQSAVVALTQCASAGVTIETSQEITAIALISNNNSGRASATTCTIVLVGKFAPNTSRRASLMSR